MKSTIGSGDEEGKREEQDEVGIREGGGGLICSAGKTEILKYMASFSNNLFSLQFREICSCTAA